MRGWNAGHGGHGAFNADVIRSRRAAPDANPATVAGQSVIGGSTSHGQVEIHRSQFANFARRLPVMEHREHPLTKEVGFHDPTVEKDCRRIGDRDSRLAQVTLCLTAQKPREMSGHGRVRFIGKSHLPHADLRLSLAGNRKFPQGEKTFDQRLFDFRTGQLRSDGAADEGRSPAENDNRFRLEAGSARRRSLAFRALCQRPRNCQASSLVPLSASRACTA